MRSLFLYINRKTIITTILLTLIGLGCWNSTAWAAATNATPSWIKAVSGSVNLRSGAGSSFNKVGTLDPGTALPVLGKQNDWYQVKTSSGSTAYVASWLVAAAAPPASTATTIDATASKTTADLPVQTAATATSSPIPVYVNGKLVKFDVNPMVQDGHTLVPVRAIFEALGATVKWDASCQTVTAQQGNTTIALKIGSLTSIINGQAGILDIPAAIIDNRTLVPLRFVGEALGGRVAWDESQRLIKIFSPTQAGDKLVAVLVDGDNVNLRSSPSVTADIVTTAPRGMQFGVNLEQDGWYQVTYMGKTAWLAGWLIKPVWKSDLSIPTASSGSSTTPPSTVPSGKQLVLNYSKAADGLHLTMQGATKLQVNVNETAGSIIYNFSNCQLLQASSFQEQIGSALLSITGSNQGTGVIVKVTLPANLTYQKSTDSSGLKQNLFIPNCITAVDRTTFNSSGERLDITTLMPAAPTQKQNGNTIVITLPGVAQGLAQSNYSYSSKSIKSVTIGQQASGSTYNTLITIETTGAAKFSVGMESNDNINQLHILLILNSDIPPRNSLVLLDPGHGGKDPGACGQYTYEKDINLAVALKVGALLTQRGIKVAYTRTTDVFVPLESESATGNIMNAALFVAIHCNWASSDQAQGTETYYYAPLSNPDLYIQKDDREKLADAIQQKLASSLCRPDRGVKTDNLSVLRKTTMPSALTELAFISNSQEEGLLNQQAFQNKAAQAIADGIAACMTGSNAAQNPKL